MGYSLVLVLCIFRAGSLVLRRAEYLSGGAASSGLHFGIDLGSGVLWMHLFVVCLKPEKYLCNVMKTKGSFQDGQFVGGSIPIPAVADCHIPDLFNGDSYCLLDVLASNEYKKPSSITFLTIANVDYSTSITSAFSVGTSCGLPVPTSTHENFIQSKDTYFCMKFPTKNTLF